MCICRTHLCTHVHICKSNVAHFLRLTTMEWVFPELALIESLVRPLHAVWTCKFTAEGAWPVTVCLQWTLSACAQCSQAAYVTDFLFHCALWGTLGRRSPGCEHFRGGAWREDGCSRMQEDRASVMVLSLWCLRQVTVSVYHFESGVAVMGSWPLAVSGTRAAPWFSLDSMFRKKVLFDEA